MREVTVNSRVQQIAGVAIMIIGTATACTENAASSEIQATAEAAYVECMESFDFEVVSLALTSEEADLQLAPHDQAIEKVTEAVGTCETRAQAILKGESAGQSSHIYGGDLQEDIDALVGDLDGGAIALIVRDGTPTQAATGSATIEGDRLSIDNKFNIGSITKVYTATLIYQLEEQGLLDTSAPLSTYLPELDYDVKVTLDSLLSHHSGIPDYAANPGYREDVLSDLDRVFTTEELIAYADFEEPLPPSSRFSYSNTGYSLLGLVIEAVTGGTLEEALHVGITTPLGLTETSFIAPPDFPDDLASAWLDPASLGLPSDTELPVMPVSAPFSGCQADCGIITTAPELRDFFEALFDGSLLSDVSLDKMTSSEPDSPDWGRGLEIFRSGDEESTAYGHGGAGTGYSSIVRFNPDSGDMTIFFASNDAFALNPLYTAYGL